MTQSAIALCVSYVYTVHLAITGQRTCIVARVTKNGTMASTSKMFMTSRQKLRFDGHEMKRSSSSMMNQLTQIDSTTKNASP